GERRGSSSRRPDIRHVLRQLSQRRGPTAEQAWPFAARRGRPKGRIGRRLPLLARHEGLREEVDAQRPRLLSGGPATGRTWYGEELPGPVGPHGPHQPHHLSRDASVRFLAWKSAAP